MSANWVAVASYYIHNTIQYNDVAYSFNELKSILLFFIVVFRWKS